MEMEIVMFWIGLIIGGTIAAIVLIVMSSVRSAKGCGGWCGLALIAAFVMVLVAGKFGFDPTAAECPPKYTGASTWQGPPLRCTVARAFGITMARSALAIDTTFQSIVDGKLMTEAGRAAVTKEVEDAIKRLSPVLAGLLLLLAGGLAIAKPFGADSWVAREPVRRWCVCILVGFAGLGTLLWTIGVLLSYVGRFVWPAGILQLWLAGLAIGALGAVALIVKTMMSTQPQSAGERVSGN